MVFGLFGGRPKPPPARAAAGKEAEAPSEPQQKAEVAEKIGSNAAVQELIDGPVAAPDLGYCLLGRSGAGKTHLLAALMRQASQSIHSFGDVDPTFSEVDYGDERLARNNKELIDQMNQVLVQGEFRSTIPNDLHNYMLQMHWTPTPSTNARRGQGAPPLESANFTIIDAAGELLFQPVSRGNRPIHALAERFERTVLHSPAVIYCMPAEADQSDPKVVDQQVRILRKMLTDPRCFVERLVVVLTKYEKDFTSYGSEAFEMACDIDEFERRARIYLPQVMCKALYDLSRRNVFLEGGEMSDDLVQVAVMPASAHGFVARNGGANLDPYSGAMLTRTDGEEISDIPSSAPMTFNGNAVSNLWEPFFIIDPFMFAATGEPGVMARRPDQLL